MMLIRSRGRSDRVDKASSSLQYKASKGNIIHLVIGLLLGLVLSSFSQGTYNGFSNESFNNVPSLKIKINDNLGNQTGFPANLTNSTLPTKKRLLRAVYGNAIDGFIRVIRELATSRRLLQQRVNELETLMMVFAHHALRSIGSEINFNKSIASLDEPGPPMVVIKRATYGPKLGTNTADGGVASRADVKWILEKFVFNSVLRIPKDVSINPFFGTTPNGQSNGQPYTLDVEGEIAHAQTVNVSIEVPEWILQSDLLISSALTTQNIPIETDKLKDVLSLATKGKIGLEIGGPSTILYPMDVYNGALTTDLINFSEDTLWGTFQNGSTFQYEGGGSGTVYITNGSTLEGISDSSYDFVLGSHYLEHLNNPLEAIVAMGRVTKH
jgi:hypothetical protein